MDMWQGLSWPIVLENPSHGRVIEPVVWFFIIWLVMNMRMLDLGLNFAFILGRILVKFEFPKFHVGTNWKFTLGINW